jgi:iron complex transport system permease protein
MILSSITSVLILINRKGYERILFFLLGSVAEASWSRVVSILPYVLSFSILSIKYAQEMNILAFGDEKATTLGIDVPKMRRRFLIFATFLTASSVAVAGVIGFVGLIIPHAVRLTMGPDNRLLFPLSCLWGGGYLISADLLARNAIPGVEIPIGVVTSLIGGPLFVYLVQKTFPK